MNNKCFVVIICVSFVGFIYYYLLQSLDIKHAAGNKLMILGVSRNESLANRSVLTSVYESTLSNVPPTLELACKIPRVSPWHPDLVKAVSPNKIVCKTDQPSLSTLTDDQELFLLPHPSSSQQPSCRYRCILDGPDKAAVKYGPWTSLIANTTHISCEFIHVECRLNESLIYTNFHSQIIVNETKVAELEKILPNHKSTSHHDVIIIVFDSTSRVNFLRMCPKSVQVLNTMYNWTVLDGFNKAGLNSFPNGLALLSGKCYGCYSTAVWKNYTESWEDVDSLVWNQFANKGYLTLLTEDDTPSDFFFYDGSGFEHKPTDHRHRSFWRACESDENLCASSSTCLRDRMKHSVMFDYVQQFLTKYHKRRPKLVVYWLVRLIHDEGDMGRLSNMDDDLANFLTENYEHLKESFLFILGDHGHRGTDVPNTDLNRLEELLPLFSMSLPQRFCESHPEAWKNVQENSNILASFYDGYVTLRDILDSQENGWDSLNYQRNWSFTGVYASAAESLLRPLTNSRTCEQIGIEKGFCSCVEDVIPLSENHTLWGQLSAVPMSHLNTILKDYPQCAQLTLDKTIGIQLLGNVSTSHTDYRVQIRAKPSNGTFEASLVKENDRFKIDGLIIRTNRYGNQSHCANVAWIREYCYCIDLL